MCSLYTCVLSECLQQPPSPALISCGYDYYLFDIHAECAGLSNVVTDVINEDNIERFRGCTIITSGAIIIGTVFGFE